MMCLKKEHRSITDIFRIFSCTDCYNYNEDYYFYLGYNQVYVYYLCPCDNYLFDSIFNSKLVYIYLEIIKHNNDIYCIFLNRYEDIEYYYHIIEMLIEYYYYIIIICS